jgi:hypothetical protein
MDGEFYSYSKEKGLQPAEFKLKNYLVACDQKNFAGESKKQTINLHAGNVIKSIKSGVLWEIENTDNKGVNEIIRTKILYNPNSMYILKK